MPNRLDSRAINTLVRRYMARRELGREDLADLLGIDENVVTGYLDGERPWPDRNLERIGRAAGYDPLWYVARDDSFRTAMRIAVRELRDLADRLERMAALHEEATERRSSDRPTR